MTTHANPETRVRTPLGRRLRETRLALQWTQERLATASGTTQACIQKIENGCILRPRKLIEIASALGVTAAYLAYDCGQSRVDEKSACSPQDRLWMARDTRTRKFIPHTVATAKNTVEQAAEFRAKLNGWQGDIEDILHLLHWEIVEIEFRPVERGE